MQGVRRLYRVQFDLALFLRQLHQLRSGSWRWLGVVEEAGELGVCAWHERWAVFYTFRLDLIYWDGTV